MHFTSLIIMLCSAAAVLSEPLVAQEVAVAERPLASQRRLVRSFGFEVEGNLGLLSERWSELTRPGYQIFGGKATDHEFAATGEHSLRFDVDGGSMGIAIRDGEIPVFPQSRYMVTARVCTKGLVNSGAVLAVHFNDDQGRQIPGTERTTEVIRTNGAWTTLAVEARTDVAEARDLVFEMRLDQPSIETGAPRLVDVGGHVWFDDIELWQLPRVDFRSDPPSGVTRLPEAPVLSASLRDLVVASTVASLKVFDLDGTLVLDRSLVADTGRADLSLDLSGLPSGWYRGEFEVRDGDRVVARSEQPLSILPEYGPVAFGYRSPEFGIALSPFSLEEEPAWLDLMLELRPDYLVLPVWTAGGSVLLDPMAQTGIDRILDQLLEAQIEPVFELAAVPGDLCDREHLDPDQLMEFLSAEPEAWQQALAPWMLQFGDEISRWRIDSDRVLSGSERVDLVRKLVAFSTEFVAAPQMEFAGHVDSILDDPDVPSSAVLLTVHDEEATDACAALSGRTPDTSLVMHFPRQSTDDRVTPRERGERLARQLAETWAAGAGTLEIAPPWEGDPRSDHEFGDAKFGLDVTGFVFDRFASLLSGRPPEAVVPLGRHARAILVGGEGPPLIVAWGHQPGVTLQVGLGRHASTLRIHDLLGGVREIPVSDEPVRLSLSGAPVVIEGVDADLGLFRGSARLIPENVQAASGAHEVELELHNPWTETLEVKVRPIGPAHWDFQPVSREITIAAGEAVRLPFEYIFPRFQTDGDVDFWFEVDVMDDQGPPIDLLIPSTILSDRVTLDTDLKITMNEHGEPSGVQVTVRAMNNGSSPISLESFVSTQLYAPKRKWLPELLPGASATSSFRFPYGHEQLQGRSIRVGVVEFDGNLRINRDLRVPVAEGFVVGVDPSAEN